MWRSNLPNKLKLDLFKTVVEPILTYGSETWTLIAKEVKRVDGCYTNLLWRVQNISWRKHFTLSQIYGDFQPLSVTLAKRRAQFAGHAFRAKAKIISDILLWKVSTGRKLTFPDTISRDSSQIRLFGAKVSVKSRPRPQDNDDDDRGGGGGGGRTEAHT